jgi:hypothetical protein
MAKHTPPVQPTIYDSDLLFLAINRLERAAVKMQAREYDAELDDHMQRAAEMFEWAAWNMSNRRTAEDRTGGDA